MPATAAGRQRANDGEADNDDAMERSAVVRARDAQDCHDASDSVLDSARKRVESVLLRL